MAFSSDGKTILTGSHDNTACLWKKSNVQKERTSAIDSSGLNSDGNFALAESYDNTARSNASTKNKKQQPNNTNSNESKYNSNSFSTETDSLNV